MRIKTTDKAWLEFVRWCHGHGLRALPAHPWTLAAYARWCEQRLKYPQIARHVIVIARAHLMACVPSPGRHPVVPRTLGVVGGWTLGFKQLRRVDRFEEAANAH